MKNNEFLNWQESLAFTYQEFTVQIIAFAPKLLGALALLLAGWVLAIIVRIATRKLIRGLDFVFVYLAKNGEARQETIRRSYAEIISKIMFWIVMIFFITATTNMLGWKMLSNWLNSLITYLPNLITGLLIILAGFLISNITRTGIINTAYNTGINQGEMLARVAQVTILLTALLIGIEQIGINVDFLTNALIVILGVLLAGATLAFSFGARTLVANIIGAQYFRKHCRIGEHMQMGDIEGSVVEVTQTAIVLETDSGRIVIPAKKFQENACQFTSASGAPLDRDKSTPHQGDAK
ncbi:mechanosensitive ion channel domain-containing protein [Litoribrevibacter euphylliae]|uniref:Small-conductance mechanosensitive channel n=1 Tax=Litoribrevibacter euphylliae TaxID=1834034 RepID=A0ABV7HGA9_9GAMM